MEIMTIVVKKVPVRADGGRERKYADLLGNVRRNADRKYANLLGNARTRTGRQNVLLTVRQDVLSVRESLLERDYDGALGKADWLIDNIDNKLAEGC